MRFDKSNCSILALLTIAACISSPPISHKPTVERPPLKIAAAKNQRLIGTAVDANALRNDPQYAATLAREFNVLTPENALKFDVLQPAQNQFDFRDGDAIVGFAQTHGMAVRGHTFVWHTAVPTWVTAHERSPDNLSSILQNYIETVIRHYKTDFPGVIKYWDVVNEAIGYNAILRKESPWHTIGNGSTDYIAKAFRWAHEADPDLLLFYNDYEIEEINAKSDAVYALIRSLLTQGVPIHGIGFQTHLYKTNNWYSVRKNFARFADLGLVIHITELDYRLKFPPAAGPSPSQLRIQADVFLQTVKICRTQPACHAIVMWGFTDKYSYIPHWMPGWGSGFVLDANYQPKPAYQALLDAFE